MTNFLSCTSSKMDNYRTKKMSAAKRKEEAARRAEQRRLEEESARIWEEEYSTEQVCRVGEASRKARRSETRIWRETEAEEIRKTCPKGIDPIGSKREKRWRKCLAIEEDFVKQIHSPVTDLTANKKRDVLKRFWEDPRISVLLPQYLQDIKEIEMKLQILESVQQAYLTTSAIKNSENLAFRNTLLSSVVSSTIALPERFVSQIMQTSRHSVQRAVVRRSRADEGENIWGGIPWQQRNDKIGDADKLLIETWWKIATTISPNKKGILYQQTGVNKFEEHAKHCLQESQVCGLGSFPSSKTDVNTIL